MAIVLAVLVAASACDSEPAPTAKPGAMDRSTREHERQESANRSDGMEDAEARGKARVDADLKADYLREKKRVEAER